MKPAKVGVIRDYDGMIAAPLTAWGAPVFDQTVQGCTRLRKVYITIPKLLKPSSSVNRLYLLMKLLTPCPPPYGAVRAALSLLCCTGNAAGPGMGKMSSDFAPH